MNKINAMEVIQLMNEYENLSIRGIAKVAGVTYATLLNASKKPIAGELYNPEAINYEAIAAVLNRKVESLDSIDWESVNTPKGKVAETLKESQRDLITVDTLLWLRKDNEAPFRVIYRTETHVVIIQEGTELPLSWSWNTLFLNGPRLTQRSL